MRQLDVTDEQLQYLERVRATLEDEYLGPYGQVDILDALQYLIDVHEATDPDMPSTDAAVVDAATPVATREDESPRVADAPVETPATNGSESVDTTDAEATTPDESSQDEASDAPAASADESTASVAANGTPSTDDAATGDATDEPTTESTETTTPDVDAEPDERSSDEPSVPDDTGAAEEADAAAGDAGNEDARAEDTAAGDEAGSPSPASGGGNDRLQAMMNLLDTHGDKWREGDGEARYEVDLPDGSVETVQTRDDVRAVLFKNYR